MTSTKEDLEFQDECAPISQEAWDNLGKSEGSISKKDAVAMYAGADSVDKSEKQQKFVSLYKSRYILSMIGTMEERRISKRMLSRMKKLGLSSL